MTKLALPLPPIVTQELRGQMASFSDAGLPRPMNGVADADEDSPMDLGASLRRKDALSLLMGDRDVILRLFRDYEQLLARPAGPDLRAQLVGRICLALSIHWQIEEELLRTTAPAPFDEDERIAHALLDRAGGRELVAMLDGLQPGDPDYDAAVAVLAEYVMPDMVEARAAIFPRLQMAAAAATARSWQSARQRWESIDES